MTNQKRQQEVGPVLIAGGLSKKIITAIKKLNKQVTIEDQGSYLRVLVPKRCELTRDAVEKETGRLFKLPDDLEVIMPAFKGKIKLTEERAIWESV